jgi:hypothetical protein
MFGRCASQESFCCPALGGGNIFAIGRAFAQSSISRVSHATRLAESALGFGKSPLRTRAWMLPVDNDTALATSSRSKPRKPRAAGLFSAVIVLRHFQHLSDNNDANPHA